MKNDNDPDSESFIRDGPDSLYDSASRLSKLTLSWLSPLIDQANINPLELDTLGPLSSELSSDVLFRTFEAAAPQTVSKDSDLSSFWGLVGRLYRAFGTGFLFSGLLKFLGDCAALSSPILLRLLLQLIRVRNEAPNEPALHDWLLGIGLGVGIFLLQSANSLSVNLYFQRTFQSGFRIRVSLTEAIYRKALRLSMAARKDFGPSKVVNLTSVDVSRVDMAISFLHYVWSGPFQTFVIVYMLYRLLGWTTFVGFGLFILFFPVQGRIVAAISRQRKRISQYTDKRLKVMSEVVSGIRIIKMHGWEEDVIRRIAEIRRSELRNVYRIQTLQAAMATITWLVPVLACVGTFLAYRHWYGHLPMEHVLPALAYFNLLRLPLVLLPVVIGFATDARVALVRIAEFMGAPEKSDYIEDVRDGTVLTISDAEFAWPSAGESSISSDGQAKFSLTISSLEMQPGGLLCIIGSIGSGKSSFLQAVLGELNMLKGKISMDRSLRVAYCPQSAWILTGTIRDNILFGLEYDDAHYHKTLRACQLLQDLSSFPSGDMTHIGERGVNLSGGQKQRVSLARAVYSRADIYLLDDTLSALDAKVANAIWRDCICGMMARSTRLLVTHSLQLISGCRTVILENGVLNEVPDSHSESVVLSELVDTSEQTVVESPAKPKSAEKVEEEERVVGGISPHVVKVYSAFFGGFLFILIVCISLILNQAVKVASDIWVSGGEEMVGADEWTFAMVYGMSGVAQGVLVLAICLLFNSGAIQAAVRLHDSALDGLLSASLTFFEHTATGRILNRFSRDVDAADNQMAECFRSVAMTAVGVLSTLLLTVVMSWPSVFVVLPALYLFDRIQKRFRPPAREIKRLDALSKAPIFSHISESLAGVPSIRAYRHKDRFVTELSRAIDCNSQPVFLYLCLQRWVSLRLEMVGNMIIFAASVFGYATANRFAFTGISIVYALNTTGALNWLIRRFSEAESQLIACERLLHYIEGLDSELSESDSISCRVPENWPNQGAIEISNLTVSYRPDRPPALSNLSITIQSGEHVGIVGRTGAGKSTIISSFFRLYSTAMSGKIIIDGFDISTIPLRILRQRLAVIPQDPVLFSGTIRTNLDPFLKHSDGEIWLALQRSGLAATVKRSSLGLDAVVDAQGENWSTGERQLMCLARALLSTSKIILMDEATSSVDQKTDAAIQDCIAKDLTGHTVIIVAHRLNTVLRCGRVVVLDAGKIVEEGPPELLSQANGPFAALLKHQRLE